MPAPKKPAATDKGWRAVIARIGGLMPGIGLSVVITAVSVGVQYLEERVFSHPYLEALVIAILLGMAIRTAWEPNSRWRPGIAFSAKQLLETAVVLLGATISYSAIAASGLSLIAAIVGTVAVILAASYGIGRLLGLPVRLSILVACGNSVCQFTVGVPGASDGIGAVIGAYKSNSKVVTPGCKSGGSGGTANTNGQG